MIDQADDWPTAPPQMTLTTDEVHVWRIHLNQSPTVVQSLETTLSADEQRRAAAYHFEPDRLHFIVARGALRTILGYYLNVPPPTLRFGYGKHGKPALLTRRCARVLRFNVTHAHELALVAVTVDRDVGIDLEYCRPLPAAETIAAQFFSRSEQAALAAIALEHRPHAFFTCWTRKEAYLKAQGDGLSLPLDQFDVAVNPAEPAALLAVCGEPQATARWSMRSVATLPSYVATLVVEGHGRRLSTWQWHFCEPLPLRQW